jgi:hypothetical protein
MKNILTFIIPVRHQDNAASWQTLKLNLSQTIQSISSQDREGWKAVIIANHGADLPDLPKGFDVKRVGFPPNHMHAQGDADQETFRNAFRIDKGRRVLAGLLHAGDMGHVMIVDDDDFVSQRLTSFVAANSHSNGWYIADGYIWTNGGALLYRHADFFHICGTSHIIRHDLYRLPSSIEAADDNYIRRTLGSHVSLRDDFEFAGTPLSRLPFCGAVYRTGHSGAHSQSRSILRQYFLTKSVLKSPREIIDRFRRLKFKSRVIDEEFFGSRFRSEAANT